MKDLNQLVKFLWSVMGWIASLIAVLAVLFNLIEQMKTGILLFCLTHLILGLIVLGIRMKEVE